MNHPANTNVLTDPAVKIFQVPVTQTTWGQGQPSFEHFVPLRRATPPIPLTKGNYSPTATGSAGVTRFGTSAARYLSFRFAETLGGIPWGVYISYEALDQGAAELCASGLAPSDGLRIAYDIAREEGQIRYALDLNFLNLGYHFVHKTQSFNPQEFSKVSELIAHLTNDTGFMFHRHIMDIACARVLKKLQRAPFHHAGVDCLSMLTTVPTRSMDQLFEQTEELMINNAKLGHFTTITQIHNTLRTLRNSSRLRKSPAGGQIPIHMMK
jgi:hypothetical protein